MEQKDNQQPTPNAEPPTPNAVQEQAVQPQSVPPQQPQPASFTNVPKKSGSNKGLVIGIIAAVVLVVIGLAAAWFLFLSPDAKAQRASSAFMTAATKGDLDKLYELAEAEDDDTKEFLKSASESVEGDFELDKKDKKDGKFYFLYDLTNDDTKYARTIVDSDEGFVVTSFVYSAKELAVIPGDSAEEAPKPTQPQEAAKPSATTPTNVCLTAADIKPFIVSIHDDPIPLEYDENGSKRDVPVRRYHVHSSFFEPDSTTPSFPDVENDKLDDLAKLLTTHKDKAFIVTLQGSTYESGQSAVGAQLARERAKTVEDALVSRGVSPNLFVYREPRNSDTYGDGSERNVSVTIDVPTDCKVTRTGSGL